jgi:hypothetical protein
MSAITRTAGKAARWSAVPALAALALAASAGIALAAGTSVGISTTGAAVAAGELTVSGAYQCDSATASYAELAVTVSQARPHGRSVDSTTVQRLTCTGSGLSWRVTLSPRQAGAWFSPASARVDAKLWTPGSRGEQADASLVLQASAS